MVLIDHLPINSFYREATALDREVAEAYLETVTEPQPREERFSEWSPERYALANIDDRLQLIERANYAKPPGFHPAPRPVSAVQRLQFERRVAQHRRLVSMLLPRGSG
jgi:hypothetical protein